MHVTLSSGRDRLCLTQTEIVAYLLLSIGRRHPLHPCPQQQWRQQQHVCLTPASNSQPARALPLAAPLLLSHYCSATGQHWRLHRPPYSPRVREQCLYGGTAAADLFMPDPGTLRTMGEMLHSLLAVASFDLYTSAGTTTSHKFHRGVTSAILQQVYTSHHWFTAHQLAADSTAGGTAFLTHSFISSKEADRITLPTLPYQIVLIRLNLVRSLQLRKSSGVQTPDLTGPIIIARAINADDFLPLSVQAERCQQLDHLL